MLFKRDTLGHIVLVKRLLITILGGLTYPRLNWLNKLKVEGTEHLEGLPETNVLFVSNHHTYFADVFAFYHILCSFKWGFKNKLTNPVYLLNPKSNIYYIAAEETMNTGVLPKILAYTGSVSIKRTFREAGKDINRQVDLRDISNIGKALTSGWVITFPQGTTTPFAKGRRGTVHIIKKYQPVIVPIVIDGFRTAFNKTGLKLKKIGTPLSVKIKPPLTINCDEDADVIMEHIMTAIEQSEAFQKVF